MTVLSPLLLLLVFSVVMIALSYFGRTKDTAHSIEEFLVSKRDVGVLRGAFSIAVSWVWAPAIFIAGLQAYTKGLPGAFWFIAPNVVCFFVFAFVATKLRAKFPDGFTLPEFIHKRYGDKRTHWAFLLIFFGYQLGAIIINCVAGGTLLNLLTGMPFWIATIGLSLTALLYSVIGGMRASVRTDVLQMVIILALALFLVPWVLGEAGGMIAITGGFGGVNGTFGNIFDLQIAWAFGIPMTISLLAGPIGDQQFFQRAFSVQKDKIVPMFVLGGIIFGVVPVLLSSFGFIAANPAFGVEVVDAQMVAPAVIKHFLPSWALLLFTLMAFAGLCSTIDSAYCAISSFVVADIVDEKAPDNVKIAAARKAMVLFAFIGTGIALLQPQLLWVFFIQGVFVSTSIFPTLFAIFSERYTSRAAFWSIILGAVLSIPMSLYANVSGNENLVVWASIFSVVIGLFVSLGFLHHALRSDDSAFAA